MGFHKKIDKNKITSLKIPALVVILAVFSLSFVLSRVGAFPTGTSIIDNFNRADIATISGQTASGGQTWATNLISGSGTPTLGISSGQLSRQGNGDNTYINANYGPDTEVFADVPVLPLNGEYVALWSRIQSPGVSTFSGYCLVYTHSTSGIANWSLCRVVNGSFSTIAGFSAPAMAAGDGLGLAITGTGSTVILSVYQKSGSVWSSIASFNDTAGNRITAAGDIGVELGANTVRLDNFGGGTIVNNTAPAAPQLSLPGDNSTSVSTSPQFQLKATDADNDDLRYKIEICSDPACATILRTIDQTSSQTGWSGQDKLSSTAYTGGSTLAASTMAVHNYQAPALANSTQYWWRAYAIDPNGTNVFSQASAIFSFTTESAASNGGGNNGSGSGNTGSNGSGSSSTDPNLTPSSYASWGK